MSMPAHALRAAMRFALFPAALLLVLALAAPPAFANDKLVCVSTLCTRSYADLGCVGLGIEGSPLSGSYGAAVCTTSDPNATGGVEILLCAGQPDGVCNHLEVVQRAGLVCIDDVAQERVTLACLP